MKKNVLVLVVIFLTLLSFNPKNVFAVSCGTVTNETACENSKDDDGTKCFWDTSAGKCKKDTSSGSGYRGSGDVDDPNGEIPGFLEPEDNVSCGSIKGIPKYIPFITSLTITVFTIISMGMLVIMGTIDLFKGINSGKPEDMKKNQKAFFNRVGSAVLLFFIVALTRLLVGFVTTVAGGSNVIDCISCFINNSCN